MSLYKDFLEQYSCDNFAFNIIVFKLLNLITDEAEKLDSLTHRKTRNIIMYLIEVNSQILFLWK